MSVVPGLRFAILAFWIDAASCCLCLCKIGPRNEANAIISRFREISKTQYVISFFVATIYAGLNEDEKAYAELETAIQERDWRMTALLKGEPMLDRLRRDPRFKELLKRMNLPE